MRGLEFLKEDLLDRDEGEDARKISICKGTEVAQKGSRSSRESPGREGECGAQCRQRKQGCVRPAGDLGFLPNAKEGLSRGVTWACSGHEITLTATCSGEWNPEHQQRDHSGMGIRAPELGQGGKCAEKGKFLEVFSYR